jgi:hypothetical protein
MKTLWSKILMMLCIASVSAGLALSQNKKPPEKETQPADIVTVLVSPKEAKEIRELLDLLPETPGGPQQTSQVIDKIIEAYRKAMPDVPNRVWQEITPQLKKDFGPDKMAEFLTPVYASRFTQDEIRQLVAFFQSPVGRKWFQKFGELQQGSYNAGNALGFLLGERISQTLKAKGYIVPK